MNTTQSCNHCLHIQNVWLILGKPMEECYSKQPQTKVEGCQEDLRDVRIKVAAKRQRENRRGAVGEEASAHQRVRQRVLWWGAQQHWDASARAGARAATANKLVPRQRRGETERKNFFLKKWLLRKHWMQVETHRQRAAEHHSKVGKRCGARTTHANVSIGTVCSPHNNR